jgi:hypothetical protein
MHVTSGQLDKVLGAGMSGRVEEAFERARVTTWLNALVCLQRDAVLCRAVLCCFVLCCVVLCRAAVLCNA